MPGERCHPSPADSADHGDVPGYLKRRVRHVNSSELQGTQGFSTFAEISVQSKSPNHHHQLNFANWPYLRTDCKRLGHRNSFTDRQSFTRHIRPHIPHNRLIPSGSVVSLSDCRKVHRLQQPIGQNIAVCETRFLSIASACRNQQTTEYSCFSWNIQVWTGP